MSGAAGDKKLGHHGGDTRKKMRAEIAFQSGAGTSHADGGGIAIRIDLTRGGREHQVRLTGELFKIGVQGARIGVEVLIRRELGRIDEDADHDQVRMLFGFPHQREMAPMERPQGGHHADAPRRGLRQRSAQVRHGRDGFRHARVLLCKIRMTFISAAERTSKPWHYLVWTAAKQVWPRWVRRVQTSRASRSANRPKRARYSTWPCGEVIGAMIFEALASTSCALP